MNFNQAILVRSSWSALSFTTYYMNSDCFFSSFSILEIGLKQSSDFTKIVTIIEKNSLHFYPWVNDLLKSIINRFQKRWDLVINQDTAEIEKAETPSPAVKSFWKHFVLTSWRRAICSCTCRDISMSICFALLLKPWFYLYVKVAEHIHWPA